MLFVLFCVVMWCRSLTRHIGRIGIRTGHLTVTRSIYSRSFTTTQSQTYTHTPPKTESPSQDNINVPDDADIVIVGGGVIGTSIA